MTFFALRALHGTRALLKNTEPLEGAKSTFIQGAMRCVGQASQRPRWIELARRRPDLQWLEDLGLEVPCDRSRRPVRYVNQLPEAVERMIVPCKRERPHWDVRKIRELLARRLAGYARTRARSTAHVVLDRHGLVKRSP